MKPFWYGSSAPNFPVKPHLHYFMEIIYVTEGNALIYINQRSIYFHLEIWFSFFHTKYIPSIQHPTSRCIMQFLKFD